MAKSDRLHDAVDQLAKVILAISDSPEHRTEWIEDAHWLLREILRDGGE